MADLELTGAEIVVRCLQAEGVKHLFGYPGGAVLNIYDEIYKQTGFEHILVRHEQAAVHAADAYSRSTGQVGVALVTSGPGATNAVTGIATAYMDSIPMVVITGQVPTPAIGMDAFQEVDTIGITRPCVKHNFLVKDVRELADTMKKAFYIAATGRPGPVVVDIPKDVTQHKCPFHYPDSVAMRSYNPTSKGHGGQIKRAVQMLLEAKRPVIYTGGGVILGNAAEQITAFARMLGFPVTSTLMGLGGYPSPDPLFLGMLGMHGTIEANMAMQHCDVLLAVGARFDDRVIGNPKHFSSEARKIIHIDVDPSSISKRVRVDVPIVGDVAKVMEEFTRLIQVSPERPEPQALKAWWAQIELWRSQDCLKYDRSTPVIKPQYVVEKLYEVTGGEAFVTSDVGQHQMWAAQYYKFDKPRRWINSGGLGTMGFGLPAAMGVQLAHPGAHRGLHHRRGQHPDEYPGTRPPASSTAADQDHPAQQRLPGHGAAVAGVLLRGALRRVLHDFPAGLREAGRGLWPRRHAHRQAGRRRGPCARPSPSTRTAWSSWTSSPTRARTCSP
jgi:acetolactate synthase-1/2/3 large subunit